MSGNDSIAKYVALRNHLVALHGVVGVSKATGSNLPRLTHADKWILAGIFMSAATRAIREHTYDGYAYSVSALEVAAVLNPLTDQGITSQIPSTAPDPGSEAWKAWRRRPIAHWVAGTKTATSDVRTFNGRPYHAWLKSKDDRRGFQDAIVLWDGIWTLVNAKPETTGNYLTVGETEALFSAIYRFVTSIPGTYLAWEIGTADQLWEDTKTAGRDALKGIESGVQTGAEAAGDAAAWAANQAGEAAGGFLDSALMGVGLWGLALVASLLLLSRAGVL